MALKFSGEKDVGMSMAYRMYENLSQNVGKVWTAEILWRNWNIGIKVTEKSDILHVFFFFFFLLMQHPFIAAAVCTFSET